MNLVPQKDKVKLDAWCCKSMLSFIKGKTNKNLGSVVPNLQGIDFFCSKANRSTNYYFLTMFNPIFCDKSETSHWPLETFGD